MSPKKAPAGPNFRLELNSQAKAAGLAAEHLDRALVAGQIAGFLHQDRDLKRNVAHKGAAMLHHVNQSKRLSRDLDSAEIRGRKVDEKAIRRALTTPAAQRVVLRIDQITARGQDSLTLILHCRSLRGGDPIGITLSINWSEPFLLAPVMESFTIKGDFVTVPVMDPRERAAEKVRAFLARGEASDAYDLWWYDTKVLSTEKMLKLGPQVKRKLATSRLADGLDLHQRFDEMAENAESEWAKGFNLILSPNDKPAWSKVAKSLARFKSITPTRSR